MPYYAKHIFMCTNQKAPGKKCCASAGGEPFVSYMKERLAEQGLKGPGKVRVSQSGCLGRCGQGPCMVIYPEGIWYTYDSFLDLDEIISEYVLSGHKVERLLIPD